MARHCTGSRPKPLRSVRKKRLHLYRQKRRHGVDRMSIMDLQKQRIAELSVKLPCHPEANSIFTRCAARFHAVAVQMVADKEVALLKYLDEESILAEVPEDGGGGGGGGGEQFSEDGAAQRCHAM